MVSFKNLFLSDSQRQVKAEAHNIGLAHTIRDLITGKPEESASEENQAPSEPQQGGLKTDLSLPTLVGFH